MVLITPKKVYDLHDSLLQVELEGTTITVTVLVLNANGRYSPDSFLELGPIVEYENEEKATKAFEEFKKAAYCLKKVFNFETLQAEDNDYEIWF